MHEVQTLSRVVSLACIFLHILCRMHWLPVEWLIKLRLLALLLRSRMPASQPSYLVVFLTAYRLTRRLHSSSAGLLIELRWLRIAVELFLSDALVRDHLPQNALLAVITEITPSQPLLFIRLYLWFKSTDLAWIRSALNKLTIKLYFTFLWHYLKAQHSAVLIHECQVY